MIVEENRVISGHNQQGYKEVTVDYGVNIANKLAGLRVRTNINPRNLAEMSGDIHFGQISRREIDLGKGRFSKADGRVALGQGERGATLIEVLDFLGQRPDDFEDCQEIHVLGTSVKRNDFSLIIVREGASEWELKTVVKADSLPNHSIALGSFFPTVKTS